MSEVCQADTEGVATPVTQRHGIGIDRHEQLLAVDHVLGILGRIDRAGARGLLQPQEIRVGEYQRRAAPAREIGRQPVMPGAAAKRDDLDRALALPGAEVDPAERQVAEACDAL